MAFETAGMSARLPYAGAESRYRGQQAKPSCRLKHLLATFGAARAGNYERSSFTRKYWLNIHMLIREVR